MEDNRQIFRKESLDRLESPEQLTDYIRVMNPGIWGILLAIILLLVGAVVWGIFGRIGSMTIPNAIVIVENGTLDCFVKNDQVGDEIAAAGARIEVKDSSDADATNEFFATKAATERLKSDNSAELNVLTQSGFEVGDYVMRIEAPCTLPDGNYTGTVHIEGEKPMSLLGK